MTNSLSPLFKRQFDIILHPISTIQKCVITIETRDF